MKIGLFGYSGDPLHDAAAAGLRQLGHTVIGQVPSAWSENQALNGLAAVVVCGMRGQCTDAARHYFAVEGTEVILIDYPHLAREDEAAGWHRVTPPDLAYLPEFAGKAPRDRLDMLSPKIKTRKRVKGQHVLVLGQRGGDPTHGLSRGQMQAWAEDMVSTLRKLTDSKIVWRPHPTEVYEISGPDGMSDPRKESLGDAWDNAWLVVTHSSSAGLQALIEGFPVIATGEPPYRDLAHDISDFKNVSAPAKADLDELLARVAYTQWTREEIATGEPFAALLPGESAAPLTASAAEEIKALTQFDGIGKATAERLHEAGITSKRLWDKAVSAEEIDALELADAQDAALRKAAGLIQPEPEPDPEPDSDDADAGGADDGADGSRD